MEVENVTMPRLAFFEKAFEARVFLKNKNNPNLVIPRSAYYEISGLEALKLIPLGCCF